MPTYLIAVCEVTNPNENFKKYAAESAKLIAAHGGKYVLRGPAAKLIKGEALQGKVVIMTEWDSLEHLEGFLNDETYVNDVAPLREGTGNYEIAAYESLPPNG
ncbi:MAG: DUF1330 domain-containing protein [Gammaproteobacteria bacterium]|nr:DUF1330 domain-containing protein [Gammaproteobacteria bacterium]MBT8444337.1 DUF1330 domain-containing protein [Gammaproteobacteria bacterium]NND37817.1 DUF1330 domain-containing protein [Gammaproteobacteria bacterium]